MFDRRRRGRRAPRKLMEGFRIEETEILPSLVGSTGRKVRANTERWLMFNGIITRSQVWAPELPKWGRDEKGSS